MTPRILPVDATSKASEPQPASGQVQRSGRDCHRKGALRRRAHVSGLLLLAGLLLARPGHAEDLQSPGVNHRLRLQHISQTLSGEIPLIVATPPATSYLPMCTTEATAFAHALGADFIALDVALSRDHVPIVTTGVTPLSLIDPIADTKTNVSNSVRNYTVAGLRQLRVRSGQPAGLTDESVPTWSFRVATLAEHIRLIQGLNRSRRRNIGIYVRLPDVIDRNDERQTLSQEVAKTLQTFGYSGPNDRAFVQSSDASELLRLRTELQCRLPLIQACTAPLENEQLTQAARVVDGLALPMSVVAHTSGATESDETHAGFIRAAHAASLLVHVTVKCDSNLAIHDDTLNRLVRHAGVDSLLTEHPDLATAWRQQIRREGALNGPFHLLHNKAATQ